MAQKIFNDWLKQVQSGGPLKVDDDSADCADVPKSLAEFLTGKSWTESIGWGNAKDIWYNAPAKYWNRVQKNEPVRVGDVVCMDGSIGQGFGHVAVVIEVSADGRTIRVIQANTFTQQAPYTGLYSTNATYIQGYLRTTVDMVIDAPTAILGYQRVVGGDGVYYRKTANRSGQVIELFAAGDIADFKGFVRGESVDGNNIWFVGAHTSNYAWSGGFTDLGTHDLADLTPSALQGYQRQIGSDPMNYRRTALVAPDNVISVFSAGDVLDLDGYVHGMSVDGNDIWFRGKYSGGFVWSGGFTDNSTHDLPDVTPTVVTTPQPTVQAPAQPTQDLSNKVVDISSNNKVTDYAALKSAVRGVIVKAGHTGKSYGGKQPLNIDPTFATAVTELGDKLVGAYWYAYPSLFAKDEAAAFLKAVKAIPAHATLWLDIEDLDEENYSSVNSWCLQFLQTVEAATGRRCGIYCNRNWFDTILDDSVKGNRPIWLAHYDTPEFSDPVPNQVAHQYTSSGSAPGITGNVDISAVLDQFFIEPAVETSHTEPAQSNNTSNTVTIPTEPPKTQQAQSTAAKDANVEAAKLLGRNGILAALSAVIAALANLFLNKLLYLQLPSELFVPVGGLVYASLLYLDKWIHENASVKLKGLIGF